LGTSAAGAPQAAATIGEAVAAAAVRFEGAGLAFGHGTGDAFDEAAFIVLEGLGLPIDDLASIESRPLGEGESRRIADLVERRISSRLPAPYLLGSAYVGSFKFGVDPRVLVPRSYIGELLAAAIEDDAPLPLPLPGDVGSILELGTGSGCLAILAALAFPEAEVDAVDISAGALEVAAANVARYGLAERVRLAEGDLFGPVGDRRYDLIIANPPYVDAVAMAALPEEYRHEPEIALAGGEDGLDLVRSIVAGAGRHLEPGGGLLCEIGRGKDVLTEAFPDTAFLWLDSAESEGEMFWLDAGSCPN
jgi:ribosomal protein L3 glutamine methyltransferase